MNKTLSRRDGAPDKSLKEMKEDIQAMLAEMRKRQLGGKKSIAEEEMEYGHTHTHTLTNAHTQVMYFSQTRAPKYRPVLCVRHTVECAHITSRPWV